MFQGDQLFLRYEKLFIPIRKFRLSKIKFSPLYFFSYLMEIQGHRLSSLLFSFLYHNILLKFSSGYYQLVLYLILVFPKSFKSLKLKTFKYLELKSCLVSKFSGNLLRIYFSFYKISIKLLSIKFIPYSSKRDFSSFSCLSQVSLYFFSFGSSFLI